MLLTSPQDQFTTNKTRKNLKSLKKTLIAIKAKNPNKPLLYFDESRFGTKTRTGLGWFIKGSRTPVKVKLGFKNFYLYSSVNPASGKSFTLLMPNVDTACMNVFLEELAEEIKEDFILIMDGAGWHKSKDLIVPKNIQIELLPPYCPELNPVERLWKFIKDNTIKNKVFETLKNLEDDVCEFVKNLTEEVVLGICK
ncbi:MAG: IS630 family transposase [Pelagibacterales bacterium]|nr:IS630 family transposase [Pelagibacterales bacterium]